MEKSDFDAGEGSDSFLHAHSLPSNNFPLENPVFLMYEKNTNYQSNSIRVMQQANATQTRGEAFFFARSSLMHP